MRVGSPCFLHYSVFCLVTCHQVLVRFRSSLDSDTLRSSCLRPSAVKVPRHTRVKPLLPKVGAPPPPSKMLLQATLVEETGYALSRTSYTYVIAYT